VLCIRIDSCDSSATRALPRAAVFVPRCVVWECCAQRCGEERRKEKRGECVQRQEHSAAGAQQDARISACVCIVCAYVHVCVLTLEAVCLLLRSKGGNWRRKLSFHLSFLADSHTDTPHSTSLTHLFCALLCAFPAQSEEKEGICKRKCNELRLFFVIYSIAQREYSNARPSLYSRISQTVLMRKRRHAGSVTHAAGRHRVSVRARPAEPYGRTVHIRFQYQMRSKREGG
jgi:hypothetical protein